MVRKNKVEDTVPSRQVPVMLHPRVLHLPETVFNNLVPFRDDGSKADCNVCKRHINNSIANQRPSPSPCSVIVMLHAVFW